MERFIYVKKYDTKVSSRRFSLSLPFTFIRGSLLIWKKWLENSIYPKKMHEINEYSSCWKKYKSARVSSSVDSTYIYEFSRFRHNKLIFIYRMF